MGAPDKWPKTYRLGDQEYDIASPEALDAAQRDAGGMLEEVTHDDAPSTPTQPDPQVERAARRPAARRKPFKPDMTFSLEEAGYSPYPTFLDYKPPEIDVDVGEAVVEPQTPMPEVPRHGPGPHYAGELRYGPVSRLQTLGKLYADPMGSPAYESEFGKGLYEAGVEAPARGFNKSFFGGSSDEIQAGLGALGAQDAESLEPRLDYERARDEYVENTYPIPNAIGKGAGYLPGLLATTGSKLLQQGARPLVGPAASKLWDAGRNIVYGGFQAANEAAGSSNPPASQSVEEPEKSVQQVLEDAGWGEAWGLGINILGETLSHGLGPLLRRWGVAQRRASAAPGTAEDLKKIRQQRGIDYMEQGLDQAFDDYGLASGAKPQSAGDVARRIGPVGEQPGTPGMIQRAGAAMGAPLDAAGAQGVAAPWAGPEADLRMASQDKMHSVPSPSNATVAEATTLENLANRTPRGRASPRDLHAQRREYQKAGEYVPGVSPASVENAPAEANRTAARQVSNALDQTMLSTGIGPYTDMKVNNNAVRDLSLLGDMAAEQADRIKARSRWGSLGTYGLAGAGGGGAALLAHLVPQLHLNPMFAGAAGALLTGPFGQKYAQDVLGQGLMATGNVLREAGNVAKTAGPRADPFKGLANEKDVTEAAMTLLQSGGDLGARYQQRFQQAMSAPEPKAAMSTLITELVQTDPDFRQYILPMLRVDATQQR